MAKIPESITQSLEKQIKKGRLEVCVHLKDSDVFQRVIRLLGRVYHDSRLNEELKKEMMQEAEEIMEECRKAQ